MDQITFNETGTEFLKGTAIINSYFFQILPYLFGPKQELALPGFNTPLRVNKKSERKISQWILLCAKKSCSGECRIYRNQN